jgi:protein-tyrosine phosphatase
MDWITDEVAIGSRIDAHDATLRANAGFAAVVSLDGSMTDENAEALGYDDWVMATLIDGAGNSFDLYQRLVNTLVDMAEGSPPVLVHCHAGRSRSVAVVAGYLVKTRGMLPKAAFDFIAGKRETAVQQGLEILVERMWV